MKYRIYYTLYSVRKRKDCVCLKSEGHVLDINNLEVDSVNFTIFKIYISEGRFGPLAHDKNKIY